MQMLRKAIEKLYVDVCSITNKIERFDETNGQNYFESVCVADSLPCRVSFSSVASAEQSEAAIIKQTVKLFIAPDVDVKAGSRVAITRNGIITQYKVSGQPAMYSSHQEISLELAVDYA